MSDKYFWLKSNGDVFEIDANEYHKLIGQKRHKLARTFGLYHILLSKDDNFVAVTSTQLQSIMINR